jgi:hypothetical protein
MADRRGRARSEGPAAGKRKPLTKRAAKGAGPRAQQTQATGPRAARKQRAEAKGFATKKGPLAPAERTRKEQRAQQSGQPAAIRRRARRSKPAI